MFWKTLVGWNTVMIQTAQFRWPRSLSSIIYIFRAFNTHFILIVNFQWNDHALSSKLFRNIYIDIWCKWKWYFNLKLCCLTCQTGPFSPVKATAFHQQTVSRVTQDREAERHDEDQQVHEAPVRNKKGNKTTCSSFKCSFNRSYWWLILVRFQSIWYWCKNWGPTHSHTG